MKFLCSCLTLFENYFSSRYQLARVGQYGSRQTLVSSSVLQGSILGPLLFNIYVSDLASLTFSSKIFQYADDTATVLVSKSYEKAVHVVQKDINILNTCFPINDIIMNTDKTDLVYFRSPHRYIQCFHPIYLDSFQCRESNHCDCQEVQYRPASKYLGLYFDEYVS